MGHGSPGVAYPQSWRLHRCRAESARSRAERLPIVSGPAKHRGGGGVKPVADERRCAHIESVDSARNTRREGRSLGFLSSFLEEEVPLALVLRDLHPGVVHVLVRGIEARLRNGNAHGTPTRSCEAAGRAGQRHSTAAGTSVAPLSIRPPSSAPCGGAVVLTRVTDHPDRVPTPVHERRLAGWLAT
eukprot:scaffold536_cov409-Prasinococcus_capsulatus_cf.AAC.14